MSKRYTDRKLVVHTVQMRNGDHKIDYADFFLKMAALKSTDRVDSSGDKIVALPLVELLDDKVLFGAYEGPKGMDPLIFNAENAQTRIEQLKEGEVLVTITHGLIDIKRKEAIIEYNHRGAKAADIKGLLQLIGRRRLKQARCVVDFNPMPDEGFIAAIQKFQRIRLASVKLARPNPSWTEWMDPINTLGEASNAHTMEVSVTADAGGTIASRAGIIPQIMALAKRKLSLLSDATVSGRRPGEKADTTISLENHLEHWKRRVPLTSNGHVVTKSMFDLLTKYNAFRKASTQRNA